jgi:hypothetical protein
VKIVKFRHEFYVEATRSDTRLGLISKRHVWSIILRHYLKFGPINQ